MLAGALRRLASGEFAYRLAREFPRTYFTQRLYRFVDPLVDADWGHGRVGMKIYERDGLAAARGSESARPAGWAVPSAVAGR